MPRLVLTDKLGSHAAAIAEIARGVEHRQYKWRNHRSAASHRYAKRREKIRDRAGSSHPAVPSGS